MATPAKLRASSTRWSWSDLLERNAEEAARADQVSDDPLRLPRAKDIDYFDFTGLTVT